MLNVIESIKYDEGFKGLPYIDPKKVNKYKEFNEEFNKIKNDLNLTIGYGTLLPLDQEEAELLLKHRLNNMIQEIVSHKPFFIDLPEEVKDIILNMAYNLGVPKLMLFKNMWRALEDRNYVEASNEMINSKWYRDRMTHNRASKLAKLMKGVSI